jgi:hypothetical protein
MRATQGTHNIATDGFPLERYGPFQYVTSRTVHMEVSMSASAAPIAAPRPAPTVPPLAVRLRLALLTLVAVYPFITGLLYVVFPLTDGWPLHARTLLIAPLMVLAMMFLIMPLLQRGFGRFIATGKF